MQAVKNIDLEIELALNIKSLALAYEEISVMRMQKIRTTVLSNRYYLDNLYPIFKEVRKIYVENHLSKKDLKMMNREMLENAKKIIEKGNSGVFSRFSREKTPESSPEYTVNYSTIMKNNKNATVLITPNARMSGNISKVIIDNFLADIKPNDQNTDYFVIGKVGESLLRASLSSKIKNGEIKYFDLPRINNEMQIYKIAEELMRYKSVNVYYGKFKNLVERIAEKGSITADYGVDINKKALLSRFIVEPSIDKVLNFFEMQVFYVLFKQKIFESELGMLGSRISAMEGSIAKSENKINLLTYKRNVFLREEDQKKQIQRVVSYSLFNK